MKGLKGVLDGCRGAKGLRISLFGTLLLVLALGACGTETETLSTQGREAFTEPDAVGAFAVGRTSFNIVDAARGGRELPVDAWYPVDPDDAVGEPAVYEVLGFSSPSTLALAGPVMSEAGPFPLVVFSHGSGGLRFQSFFLTELLASHGFVVVAPDHVGNTLLDELGGTFAPLEEMMVARPLDVSILITRMLERNEDPGDPFYRGIHTGRIGVCGHSFGGFTSFAAAAGFGTDLPEDLASQLPEDFEPVPPDRRVDAIAPIAPASSWFGDRELEAIIVPTMIIGGTQDTTTPIASENVRPFELISGRVFRADLDGAVHFSFSNSCDLIRGMRDRGIPQWLINLLLGAEFTEPCGSGVLDVQEAHRITNLYTISLFKRYLKGDGRYDRFLTGAYAQASEPAVSFYVKPE